MRYIVNGQFTQVTAVVNGKEVDVIETILRNQKFMCKTLARMTWYSRLNIAIENDGPNVDVCDTAKNISENIDQILNNETT